MKKRIAAFLLVCLLALSLAPAALAGGTQPYIMDNAGILSSTESYTLEKEAENIAQRYGVGVYILTVNDYSLIDARGAYEAAYSFYHSRSLGAGAERNGAILLLSLNERDFALFCYGEESEYAFSKNAQAQIEEVFLDNFARDDWFGGFSDYLSACGEYLARRSPALYIGISCAAALLIAFLVCTALKAKMKSVYVQARADNYASGSLRLARQTDRFTHRTETRRKIEPPKPSGGGGGSVAHTGGGGSGRSGKF